MPSAGRHGENVRSDCWINVEPGGQGLDIHIQSKVKALYDRQIEEQLKRECEMIGLTNARIEIDDNGALPFVISARFEAAMRRANIEIKNPVFPQQQVAFKGSEKDRLRRSRLYLPGNTPHLFLNAGLHEPDGIILDLEDSVSPGEKDAARPLVRNALLSVDFYKAERMVRINQLPMGLEDLHWIVPYGVQLILLPKCEHPDQVKKVDAKIAEMSPGYPIWLLPIIESARGCFQAYDIAGASPHIVGLAIGLEDYTADIGASRTPDARESLWAQSMIVNAAKAHGLQAIGSVFADVEDLTGCLQAARHAKSLGFDGMGCIHPRQITTIHAAFRPEETEIEYAKRVVLAFQEAQAQGVGVVALGSKMIDAPVVKRAQTVIRNAIAVGLLSEDWQNQQSGER